MTRFARTCIATLAALALLGSAAPSLAGSRHGGGHGGHHGWHGGGAYYGGSGLFWGGVGLGIGLGSAYYGPYNAPYYSGYYSPWAYPGYAVVARPPIAYYEAPVQAAPREAAPAATAPAPEPIIYPRNGQSPEQTEADRRDCNRWATTQPRAMSEAGVFHRATLACMEGRGYTVK